MRAIRIDWDLEKLRRLVRDALVAGTSGSVKELACAAGLKPWTLYAILNGYTSMRPETARKLAQFFGVDVSDLVHDPSRATDRVLTTNSNSHAVRSLDRAAVEHEVRLELPLPPSTNMRYVRRRNGQLALTRAARDYDLWVYDALGRSRPRVPERTPVAIAVELIVDHRRRRDLDNVLKQLLDSLARALAFDDAWIERIVAEKRVVQGEEPRVKLVVSWLEEPVSLNPCTVESTNEEVQ
jgi:Holliday junction resolvase RusA-like endonuclease/DNA-binding XRE family transcriptional regulator